MNDGERTISIMGKVGRSAGRGVGFRDVDFPAREWAEKTYDVRYFVFVDDANAVPVQATSAAEAIRKSGVARPVRVIRGKNMSAQATGIVQKGRLVTETPAAQERETEASEASST